MMHAGEENINELRRLLDEASSERAELLNKIDENEKKLSALRKQYRDLMEERDELANGDEIRGQRLEILQEDIKSLELQFQNAVQAKCEALARLNEIESKETVVTLKEKNLEQDRARLNARIQNLGAEVQNLQCELSNSRREFSAQIRNLESCLNNKTLELKTSQHECSAYKRQNDELNATLQELSAKIRRSNEEFAKMTQDYLKEIESKEKVMEVYKKYNQMDCKTHNELTSFIEKQKELLKEQAAILDSKETELKALYLKYQEDMEGKDKLLSEVKKAWENVKEALNKAKDDNLESIIAKIAPTAAITCHAKRLNMTFSEVYILYVKAKDELSQQKSLYAQLRESKERYSDAEEQRREYEKLVENYKVLENHNSSLKAALDEGNIKMQELSNEVEKRNHQLKREKMKVADLNQQICFVLKINQSLRTGIADKGAEFRESDDMITTSDSVISSQLVPFNSIQDLMEKNTKLLVLVRELSGQNEEYENQQKNLDSGVHQMFEKKLEILTKSINEKNELIAMYVRRCEYLKKILHTGSKMSGIDEPDDMEIVDSQQVKNLIGVKRRRKATDNEDIDRASKEIGSKNLHIQQLELEIDSLKEQYKTLKEKYECCLKEIHRNDRLLHKEAEDSIAKIRELTINNCRLMTDNEFLKSQAQIHLTNIAELKKQIKILEERAVENHKLFVKHEHDLRELLEVMNKTFRDEAALESEVKDLRQDNCLLKESLSQLQAENGKLVSTTNNETLWLDNLETIRKNIERSDKEGRERAERRLDACFHEITELRCTLKKNADIFAGFERDKEEAIHQLKEAQKEIEELRAELASAREDIQNKAKEIEDISKKLQDDNPFTVENKWERDLDLKLQKAEVQLQTLQTQLQQKEESSIEYQRIAKSTEHVLKELTEKSNADTNQYQKHIEELKAKELEYKSRISELEAEVQSFSTAENRVDALKLQNDLSSALQDLSDSQNEIQKLHAQNVDLEKVLSETNSKLINEMNARSIDLQELSNIRNENEKICRQMGDMFAECVAKKLENPELNNTEDESVDDLKKEHDELKERFKDITEINNNLLIEIEILSNQLSLSSHTRNATCNNDSFLDASVSSSTIAARGLDHSQANGPAMSTSNEECSQIIKYLRKKIYEAESKLDPQRAERYRFRRDGTTLQKELDNLKAELDQERMLEERNSVSRERYDEVLKKLEDIKSLKNSNCLIRQERDEMAQRLTEMSNRIRELEEELIPLKNIQRDLNAKINALTAQNSSLHTEATKWRKRANFLVEKNIRHPEEFKRLQAERESLAKIVTDEKETARQLMDELNAVRNEKTRLGIENTNLQRKLQVVIEETEKEKKRAADECTTQNKGKLCQEVLEMRNKLLQKDDEVEQMQKDLNEKKTIIADLKSKKTQLRKLAKQYKDQFIELKNKSITQANGNAGNAQMEPGNAGSLAASAELLQYRNEVERLNSEICTMQTELERRNRAHNVLRHSSDKKLREAKSHIASLTKSKRALAEELKTMRQMGDPTDNAVVRLSRENERLNVCVMRLNHQLNIQQTTNPSADSFSMVAENSSYFELSSDTPNAIPLSGSSVNVEPSSCITTWRVGENQVAKICSVSLRNTAIIPPTSHQTKMAVSSCSSTLLPIMETIPSSAGCSDTTKILHYIPSTENLQEVEFVGPPQHSNESTVLIFCGSQQQVEDSSQTAYSETDANFRIKCLCLPVQENEVVSATVTSIKTDANIVYQDPRSTQCDHIDDGVSVDSESIEDVVDIEKANDDRAGSKQDACQKDDKQQVPASLDNLSNPVIALDVQQSDVEHNGNAKEDLEEAPIKEDTNFENFVRGTNSDAEKTREVGGIGRSTEDHETEFSTSYVERSNDKGGMKPMF